MVASHAVKVPVTNNLSSEISGFLPVHCIHQLLKSRTFSKHRVPIKDWIYRQMCISSSPLHPVLPALIEVFVNSILVPASSSSGRGGGGSQEQTNEPISEQEIRAVFEKPAFEAADSSSRNQTPTRRVPTRQFKASPRFSTTKMEEGAGFSLATQILMLYYTLMYESVRLSHMRTIITTQRKVLRYSQELLSTLPIKYLLKTAEKDPGGFGVVFPQLLKLCSTQYPHLCLVQDWLEDEASSKDYAMAAGGSGGGGGCQKKVSEAEVKEAFATMSGCPARVTMVIEKLLTLPANQLWKFSDVALQYIRDILKPTTPRQVRGNVRLFTCQESIITYFCPRRAVQAVVVRAEQGVPAQALGDDDQRADAL